MNASQLTEKVKQFGQAVAALYAARAAATRANDAERERIVLTQQAEESTVTAAWNTVAGDLKRTSDERSLAVEQILVSVDDTLSSINDPHWHRMKTKYYAHARETATSDLSGTADTLFAKLEALYRKLLHKTEKLQNAFISPETADTIGHVFKSYRKRRYTELAELREQILCCAEAIVHLPDIAEKNGFAASVKDRKVSEIAATATQRLNSLPQNLQGDLARLNKDFGCTARRFFDEGLFNTGGLYLGQLEIDEATSGIAMLLPFELADNISAAGASVPIYASSIDDNFLFVCDGNSDLTGFFSSLALDIVKTEPEALLRFVDLAGIGRNYTSLSRPCEKGRAVIWYSETDLLQGLENLCGTISETYSTVLEDAYESLEEYNEAHPTSVRPHTYVFIDGICENLTDRAWEQFRRIVDNGKQAGVRLVVSVRSDDTFPQQSQEHFRSLLRRSNALSVFQNRVFAAPGVTVRLPAEVSKEKIDAACDSIDFFSRFSAVIPLGSRLPSPECWHKKTSEDCIEVSIGLDNHGNEHSLVLSEDRPYALIIGDVDAGKSSLLHTIALQTMANYDESEVKLAFGDFKDGAEFNIYAAARLPSVEAVVENEDPDVKASFLCYYVQQMHIRQRAFEQLEARTNRLVRKYETYREVCRDTGIATHDMPRIVLIIDEYQSLFENACGTSTLINELVRKGRTYGIHVVMASQRAVTDSPKNTFTSDLKNYFTSRFVFKAPQAAARLMLSDRCADTGRENSGILKAALLQKGHAIYSSYMGQTERDNNEVQCFYADDALISNACRVLVMMRGSGTSVLLRRDAELPICPAVDDSAVVIGVSPCLHNDYGKSEADVICDDIAISVKVSDAGKNIICTGPDDRVTISAVASACRYMQNSHRHCELHIFGDRDSRIAAAIAEAQTSARFHSSSEMREELSRQLQTDAYCVNVFVKVSDYSEYAQSVASFHTSADAELLKRFLSDAKGINVLHAESFRDLKSSFPYVVAATSVYLTSVGDAENIRSVAGDRYRGGGSSFDALHHGTINAYYYNKRSGKFGKVIMYP